MKKYSLQIEQEALTDIQEITDWYNEQQKGLGKRFQKTAIKHINTLDKDPHIYAIRYKQIRCQPIKTFPYIVHFYINEETHTVEVLAVICTVRNPKIWNEKTKK